MFAGEDVGLDKKKTFHLTMHVMLGNRFTYIKKLNHSVEAFQRINSASIKKNLIGMVKLI